MKFLIVGPSGSGKSTTERLIRQLYNMSYVISTTDRPMRENEISGQNYYFITTEKFIQLKEEGKFAQTSTHHGYNYGAQLCHVPDTCLVVVNVEGVYEFIKTYGVEDVHVIVFECPQSVRVRRLLERGDCATDIVDRAKFENDHFSVIQSGVLKGVDVGQSIIHTDQPIDQVVADVWYTIRTVSDSEILQALN